MTTEHRYELFIHASRERVWAALIEPEFTRQYFHGVEFRGSLMPGSRYVQHIEEEGADAVEGTIEVFEPPAHLAYTWHVLYDPAMMAEPPSRVEFVLRQANEANTVTRVTLIHGGLANSPLTREHARLGWVGILDNLKSLLETGVVMPEFSTNGAED